jgi:hypothetical protein
MGRAADKKSDILSCLEAVNIMCRKTRRKANVVLQKINCDFLTKPWISLSPGAMVTVVEHTGEKIIVLVACGKDTYDVYFDGSRMPQNFSLKVPVRYWYFKKSGALRGIYQTPRWTVTQKRFPSDLPQASTLNDALKTYPFVSSKLEANTRPSNHKELERVFEARDIRNVVVRFVVSWKKFTCVPWHKHVYGNDLLTVYAYKNRSDEIQYAMLENPYGRFGPSLARNPGKAKPASETENLGGAAASGESRFYKSLNNRRSSMCVLETGLNLALRLGVIGAREFIDTSKLLGCLNGFLFCKLLHCNTITCMSYVDFDSWHTVLVTSDASWHEMFAYVRERSRKLSELKSEALKGILEKLEVHGKKNISSKHKQCYRDLLLVAKRTKVFTYDSDDAILHQLKLPFANYLHATEGKKFSCVSMKVARDNSLTSIAYRNLSIVNFGAIMSMEHHTNVEGDHSNLWKGMEDWSHDAGRPDYFPPDYSKDPMAHCLDYAKELFNLFQNFSGHLLNKFSIDVNSMRILSLPVLSNAIFWHAYLDLSPGKFLTHPVEKSLPANDDVLRKECHGGYSYSARKEFFANQINWNDGGTERANSICSLDLTASYGYAASNTKAPGGFGSTWHYGKRQETSQRYRFFEFKSVFYTIYKWQTFYSKKLIAAYHNYSPLGVYSVGKYPIDLVGIFEDGSMEIIQMDGAYCHGCPSGSCPDLPSYADGKSRRECEDKTEERNMEIYDWIGQQTEEIKFYVVTDCCNPEYSRTALNLYFRTIPELAKLVEGYSSIDGRLDNPSKNLTFLAIANVKCSPRDQRPANGFEGPLFLDSKRMAWSGRTLLTKDYFDYLRSNFNVEILSPPEWAVFYKIDAVFPLVYRYLLEQRNVFSGSSAVAKFYKSVVNLSCGFFGSNPSANKPSKCIRLTDKVPKNYAFKKHRIITIQDLNLETLYPPGETYHTNKNVFFVVHSRDLPPPPSTEASPLPCKPGMQSLPIFASVIEFGKLRLNEIFHFYHLHIPKERFRVVYAHVDSTILILSTPSLKEAAARPEDFEKEWTESYFSPDEKIPGKMHLEFSHDSSARWKFITAAPCTWALCKEDGSGEDDRYPWEGKNIEIFKMPGISQRTNSDMYNNLRDILNTGKAVIPTQKRMQKLAGTQVTQIQLNYVQKKN